MKTLNRIPPMALIILGVAISLLGLFLILHPAEAHAQSAVPSMTGPDLGLERTDAFTRSLKPNDNDAGLKLDGGTLRY